jgi:hypothetical protein
MKKRDNGGWASGSAGDDAPREFVNQITLSLSLSEIRFDLAAVGARPRGRLPAWCFVTTPDHLAAIHRDLGSALDRYRVRFGDIYAAATASADIRFHNEPRSNPRGKSVDG